MSKWVKIVLSQEISLDEYGDYYSRNIIRDSITDWEEVSDGDYKFLLTNLHHLFKTVREAGMNPCLLVKDEQPIIQRIQSVREEIRRHQDYERKRLEKEEQEKAERTRKRLMKKAANEIELLKQLQEKYGTDPEKALKE